jgi:hypothetical protein
MLKQIFIFFFIIVNFYVFSQGWMPVGARSMSLANASVCLEDVWGFHHNPAALGNLTKTSLGFSYENRFTLKELQTQGMVLAHPMKKGVLSIGAQLFGYNLYRSNRLGLGYSLKLAENLSFGVQLNYQTLRISNYLNKGTVTGELGILAKINEKVSFGVSIFNLNRAKLVAFQDDRFSTYLRMGLSYILSSKVILLAEVEKEISSKIRPKGAIEYQVANQFFLRIGAAGNPIELTFGLGYVIKNRLKIDIGSAWEQLLGWSPHVGLSFDLNKKSND